MDKDSLLNSIVDLNIADRQQLQYLNLKYQGDYFFIIEDLVKQKPDKREDLGRLWGNFIGVAYVNLKKSIFQNDIVNKIPEIFASKKQLIPVYKLGKAVTVACADPKNQILLNETKEIIGEKVSFVFSFPDEINDAIQIQYRSHESLRETIKKVAKSTLLKDENNVTTEQLKIIAGKKEVVQFVHELMLLGIKKKASDIHIEPAEDDIRVRFRIDGVLQEGVILDKAFLPQIASRLKILAGVDIIEKRKPHDGSIVIKLENQSIDFRFSSIPTIYGEKIVLRILGEANDRIPDLNDLFFSKSVFQKLKRVIEAPSGVFFITGPTGSGKTTTLYSILKYLNKPEVNIMTIEDPVEYRLAGINQVQVNPAIGMNFATSLRSFLRQDPDIMLIGEIRDVETARIASQAALTGHLVLATMHTNNSIQAITRLIEIGVEPFLVAPAIIGVMSQRLVRKICENCKEKYRPHPEKLESIFEFHKNQEIFFYRGKGCNLCNNTGYSGRVAVHELFILADEVRSLVASNASILEIKRCAMQMGFKDIWYDGIKKVLRGLTTLEELNRVLIEEL